MTIPAKDYTILCTIAWAPYGMVHQELLEGIQTEQAQAAAICLIDGSPDELADLVRRSVKVCRRPRQ